jgi:hypothetical protein
MVEPRRARPVRTFIFPGASAARGLRELGCGAAAPGRAAHPPKMKRKKSARGVDGCPSDPYSRQPRRPAVAHLHNRIAGATHSHPTLARTPERAAAHGGDPEKGGGWGKMAAGATASRIPRLAADVAAKRSAEGWELFTVAAREALEQWDLVKTAVIEEVRVSPAFGGGAGTPAAAAHPTRGPFGRRRPPPPGPSLRPLPPSPPSPPRRSGAARLPAPSSTPSCPTSS